MNRHDRSITARELGVYLGCALLGMILGDIVLILLR
jgi:hypothetical protein